MSYPRVVVTGLGVVSSIGVGVEAFWDALMQGKSGVSPVEAFDTSGYFNHNGAEVKSKDLLDEPKHSNRASQFAITACKEALDNAQIGADSIASARIATIVGTTMAEAQAIEAIDSSWVSSTYPTAPPDLFSQYPATIISSNLASYYNFSGPAQALSNACAAGNYAIIRGADLIRRGRADFAVVGGSDAFSRIAFTGFNRLLAMASEKCQPFDKNRKGMILGEGAGILILESSEHASRRGVSVLAEVKGIGMTCDANHMTIPSVDGVSGVMMRAIEDAGLQTGDVDYISAHGTGTQANDSTEALAISKVFGKEAPPVSSIKSMLGHTMGAASSLEAVSNILSIMIQEVPPTINFFEPSDEFDIDAIPNQSRKLKLNNVLNNSFAFGGNNACVCFCQAL